MSSDDETRVMPVPPELRLLMLGATPSPDAETPCVGVPSVGDTHFGETQVALSGPGATGDVRRVSPAPGALGAISAREPRALEMKSTGAQPLKRTRPVGALRVPKAVALAIGLLVGIGGALVIGLLQNRATQVENATGSNGTASSQKAPSAAVPRVTVETIVQTEDGAGVAEVPVRVRNQVVLTDEAGRAPFAPLALDGPLTVTAECPKGYEAGRLAREIPRAVASSSSVWTFQLVCRPEFSDVSLLIETEGCGEMRIWIDGTDFGTTSEGKLQVNRRIHGPQVVEVKAQSESGSCEFESVQHAALAADKRSSTVVFKGKAPRRLSRGRKTPSPPLRPYRL
jgi:hypothetical protein